MRVDSVLVTLKLPFGDKPAGCQVMLPGIGKRAESVVVTRQSSQQRTGQEILIQLQARLFRGCAVLQCSLE